MVKDVVRNDLVVVPRCMREGPSTVDVTHSEDPVHAGAKVLVGDDVSAFVYLDSRSAQVEVVRIRLPSDCQKDVAALYLRSTMSTVETYT